jgi:hypothetical protein
MNKKETKKHKEKNKMNVKKSMRNKHNKTKLKGTKEFF